MTTKVDIFPLIIAENMWTLPYLPIGMVTAYLRAHDGGALAQNYNICRPLLGGVASHPLADMLERIRESEQPICLLSSYVWNHKINMATARDIKTANPEAIVIIGGPEIPKFDGITETFLEQHQEIDVVVLGEGEIAAAEILSALLDEAEAIHNGALGRVGGIAYNCSSGPCRTSKRERLKDINVLPSPYLTGEYEPWFRDISNAVIETNRGCPYGCTYCDWGSATLQKVTRFDPARVIAEVEYIASTRAPVVFIADANFGMLEQDIEIAHAIVDIRKRTGFPQKLNSNFAKNGGRRLMEVIKILHRGGLLPTGIIALQTTDEDVLKAIRRDNIKTSSYIKMMEYFNSENIPMASDIMVGLPGQTVDSLERDLQFCFDWKLSANGNYTSMMPNAPMAQESYAKRFAIATDADGLIESTSTFSREELAYMKSLFMAYQFHVRLGVLKYFLYYLQIEHGVAAINFIRHWLDCVLAQHAELPISLRLYTDMFAMESRNGDWVLMSWGEDAEFFFQNIEAFYDEVITFAKKTYSLTLTESVCDTLVQTQAAVMPRLRRQYPFRVELRHDVNAYFEQVKNVACIGDLGDSWSGLDSFAAGSLDITPKIRRKKSIAFTKVSGHTDDWELPSQLRFY